MSCFKSVSLHSPRHPPKKNMYLLSSLAECLLVLFQNTVSAKYMNAFCCWFIDTWDFSPLALAMTRIILCQGCCGVKELHVPFPGGMSHTWSPGGFLSWCKLFSHCFSHRGVMPSFQTKAGEQTSLVHPWLTSEWFGFCLEGKLREDLSLSSLSCRVNWNCEHWEAVASVSKQKRPHCYWGGVGALCCPASGDIQLDLGVEQKAA